MKYVSGNKLIHFSIFVAFLALVSACGKSTKPAIKTSPAVNEQKIKEETFSAPVITTEPKKIDTTQYQAPSSVINTKSKKPIWFNLIKLNKTVVNYDAASKKMKIEGELSLLNNTNQDIAHKNFKLEGSIHQESFGFKLKDEGVEANNNVELKGYAFCKQDDGPSEITSCKNAFVDLYVRHDNKYYYEQIQIDPKAFNDNLKPEEQGNNPSDDDSLVQEEGDDGSIDGRFVGSDPQNIDLEDVFSESAILPLPNIDQPQPAAPVEQPDTEQQPTPVQPVNPPSPEPVSPPAPVPTPAPVKPVQPPAPTPSPVKPPQKPPVKPVQPAPVTPSPVVPQPVKPEDKPTLPTIEEAISVPNIIVLKNGDVRPINQAIGLASGGKLKNATSMLQIYQSEQRSSKVSFTLVHQQRKRYFGTYEMALMLQKSSDQLMSRHQNKLYIGDISAQNGGKIGSHKSHQAGIDADLGYPNNNNAYFPTVVPRRSTVYHEKNYSLEKTYNTFKHMFLQPHVVVEKIFVDQIIKNALCKYAKSKGETVGKDKAIVKRMFENIQHVDGHGDHFHLRLKCSSYDPSCRNRIYKKVAGCI